VPSDLSAVFWSRRRLIQHVGLAAAAVAGLGSCSSASESTPSPTPVPSGGGGPQTAQVADIPVGGGVIFPDSQTVITQPTEGKFAAFSSICTHARCPLADVTTTINCRCHGSQFSITDGSVVHPPAPNPLPTKQLTVDGATLQVAH